MTTSTKIDFGFTEPFPSPWRAKCKYMPCKVGGRPAFLALSPVLGPSQLTCDSCGKILRFILQIYAPVDPVDDAFHRTLFVFACGRTKDCADQFRVYRSQLSKKNRFYSDTPPDYDAEEETDVSYDPNPEQFGVQLCPVCGMAAPHRCAKCQKASYCSRDHQVAHWKSGGHKAVCDVNGADPGETKDVKYEGLVFPELELVIGGDDSDRSAVDADSESDDAEVTESEMYKYQEYLRRNQPSLQSENMDLYTNNEVSKGKRDDTAAEDEEQDLLVFERFKKQSKAGEAVRYRTDWYQGPALEGDILWISIRNQPTSIPKCEQCGSARLFEFQIMPQLLNDLREKNSGPEKTDAEDQLDWGTLLVFSCPKSCSITTEKEDDIPYVAEFIYNQPA